MGAFNKALDYLGLHESEEETENYVEEYEETEDKVDADILHFPSSEEESKSLASAYETPFTVTERRAEVRRIVTVCPNNYNEAKQIGEAFREGAPVIMNLSNMGDLEARRMIDFAAGLIFGLEGSIEKVTARVFLLSPKNLEVDNKRAFASGKKEIFNQS